MNGPLVSFDDYSAVLSTAAFSPDPWLRRPTVLVIEDHSALNLLLGIRLRHRGFEVRAAFDGVEGIQRAVREEPDLILLDLGLPKLSGRDVLRALREHPGTFDTPVLVITGDRDARATREAASWESVRKVFYKPTPATQIVSAIESILNPH